MKEQHNGASNPLSFPFSRVTLWCLSFILYFLYWVDVDWVNIPILRFGYLISWNVDWIIMVLI